MLQDYFDTCNDRFQEGVKEECSLYLYRHYSHGYKTSQKQKIEYSPKMLSLIVCSRNKDIPQSLKENVCHTIGSFPFEWVIIDNSKNHYNIFQAYNKGVCQAKGDILCFMHDDVTIRSEDWGKNVYNYFKTYPKLGCLGVAGGHLMLDTPSSFWHSEAVCMHYYGRDNDGDLLLIDDTKFRNPNGLTQVASVDGLWMCIRRNLFNTIRFDDISYSGFHCYDSDICMQILQVGYDIGIAFDILVEHSKRGSQDASYFKSIKIWHEKWHDMLPLMRGGDFSAEEIVLRTSFVKNIISLEKQVSELEQIANSKVYQLSGVLRRTCLKWKQLDF